jgi:hypothetical protein
MRPAGDRLGRRRHASGEHGAQLARRQRHPGQCAEDLLRRGAADDAFVARQQQCRVTIARDQDERGRPERGHALESQQRRLLESEHDASRSFSVPAFPDNASSAVAVRALRHGAESCS